MGRYDRIKVFDGSSFRKPNRIKVFNGSVWKDLGIDTNTTDNGRIKVYNGSSIVEATKHYVTHSTTVYGDYYTNGEFAIANASHYCFCPNAKNNGSWQSYNKEWDFSCTAKKDGDSNQLLLYIGSSSESTKIKITWLADGRLQVETRFNNGTTYYLTSDNAVHASQGWVSIRVHQARNSNTMEMWFDGNYKTGTMYGAFSIGNATGKAGSNGTHFKYNFYLQGGGGSSAGSGTISQDATSLTSNTSQESWTDTYGEWE